MSKDFTFTIELDHKVEQVHAVLTSEQYWKNRGAGSSTGSVETEVPAGPGTIRVRITEETPTEAFPAVVRGVLRGGPLVMNRGDEWGALEGDTARGTMTGGTEGLPVTIEGRWELAPRDGGSVLAIAGQVTVKVPVVGGQIEGMIVQMAEAIVTSDREALTAALA